MVMGSEAEEMGQKETDQGSWKASTSSPLTPTPMQLLPLPRHFFKNNMKRMANGSVISLIPFRSSGEDQEELYGGGFRPIADGMEENIDGADDEEACGAASGGAVKKRRLSTEQVRALEKSFEMENKLEPERKVRLATDLGLQPRQIAVWFQNRRARWKTKQLERDYAALQASYDALRLDFGILRRDKESLLSQIDELKSKLAANDTMSLSSAIKEESAVSETVAKEPSAAIAKVDGASDSDSSALVNDTNTANDVENSPPLTAASNILSAAAAGGDIGGGCSSALMNPNSRSRFFYQNQEALKRDEEEEELLSEPCPCASFFADEQAGATLSWYYSGHWN